MEEENMNDKTSKNDKEQVTNKENTANKDKDKTDDSKSSKEEVKNEPLVLSNDDYVRFGMMLNLKTIIRGVECFQQRLISRALRCTIGLRKRLTLSKLYMMISGYLPDNNKYKSILLESISLILKSENSIVTIQQKASTNTHEIPMEIIYYFLHIIFQFYNNKKLYLEAAILTEKFYPNNNLLSQRTLDLLLSKFIHWHLYFHWKIGQYYKIRSQIFDLYRTSCLKNNTVCQAKLINSLLYYDIQSKNYESAMNFIEKSSFPDTVSNNQLLRYLYCCSYLDLLTLHYNDALNKLNQLYQKVPIDGAFGFKRQVVKLLVVATLLIGDTPHRMYYTEHPMCDVMKPYLHITQAVRNGDPTLFQQTYEGYYRTFKNDHLENIIKRISHNVIKTGLCRINLSYQLISLKDITEKLCFTDEQDTLFVCCKAIRDGIISAEIDYERKLLVCKDVIHDYCSNTILDQLKSRIEFCQSVHCEAVKSMRYPLNQPYKPLDAEPDLLAENDDEDIFDMNFGFDF